VDFLKKELIPCLKDSSYQQLPSFMLKHCIGPKLKAIMFTVESTSLLPALFSKEVSEPNTNLAQFILLRKSDEVTA